jgi:midasin
LSDSQHVQYTVARVLPFLEQYLALVDVQVSSHANWSKGLFKLNFTLCSIMRTLAKDGFCQPRDTEAGEAGEGQGMAEGTGLGEGSGSENVSKEIQDESQVEGLQGEDGQSDEKVERAEEGNAVEISEDFGGEMQDVPEQEDNEGEAEEEEGSEVDHAEQIGDINASDENAVDETLWGDEKGPEAKDDSGKTNQDHSKQQTGESEIVGKEGEQPKLEKKEEHEGFPEESEEQPTQDEAGESLPDEEPVGNEGAPMDEHIQQAETLNLPDDIEMDQDAQDQDASSDVEGDLMEEDLEENADKEGATDEGQDDAMDDGPLSAPQAMHEDSQEAEGTAEEDVAIAQADTQAGDGKGSGEEAQTTDAANIKSDASDDINMEDISAGHQGVSKGSSQNGADEQAKESAK